MKTLLVIENDMSLDRADYVNSFIRQYDGEVIEMTNFANKERSEIYAAVSKCTDIAVQTCFVNGSDYQLIEMAEMLAKIKRPINVYIAYLGISYQNELFEYLEGNLSPELIINFEHHNIYAMSRDKYESQKGQEAHLLLDFTRITKPLHKSRSRKSVHKHYLDWYKETAWQLRKTGRKILILGCNAQGKAFQNLPIGQEVDELKCNELSTNGVSRGVWIMGNGEPIMLVNDHGFNEYQIVTKLSIEELFEEIVKTTDIDGESLKRIEIEGLLHIIKDKEESLISKANIICEETGIEKRHNRQKIYSLLENNLV